MDSAEGTSFARDRLDSGDGVNSARDRVESGGSSLGKFGSGEPSAVTRGQGGGGDRSRTSSIGVFVIEDRHHAEILTVTVEEEEICLSGDFAQGARILDEPQMLHELDVIAVNNDDDEWDAAWEFDAPDKAIARKSPVPVPVPVPAPVPLPVPVPAPAPVLVSHL